MKIEPNRLHYTRKIVDSVGTTDMEYLSTTDQQQAIRELDKLEADFGAAIKERDELKNSCHGKLVIRHAELVREVANLGVMNDQLYKERDEALAPERALQREVCNFYAKLLNQGLSQEPKIARKYAKSRGWDCFEGGTR